MGAAVTSQDKAPPHTGNHAGLTTYNIHPYAAMLPMPSEQEMQSLTESIRTHGQLEPIKLLNNLIVDGRSRYFASPPFGCAKSVRSCCASA